MLQSHTLSTREFQVDFELLKGSLHPPSMNLPVNLILRNRCLVPLAVRIQPKDGAASIEGMFRTEDAWGDFNFDDRERPVTQGTEMPVAILGSLEVALSGRSWRLSDPPAVGEEIGLVIEIQAGGTKWVVPAGFRVSKVYNTYTLRKLIGH